MDPSTLVSVKEGDIIAGKYRLERTLGVGGMGVVFSAMHLQLDQRVAIKLVLPGATDRVDRFLREARAVVRLRSEHVARVLDVGTMESGEPFMVMEYLEGKDVARLIEEQGALSVEAAAEIVVQACEAVAEAHSIGIVHRDLKPQNLFLTRGVGGERVVKVLDFGISKVISGLTPSATQTQSMMGSPMYMAPEQMRSSKDAMPQSDVWALGVVLQELLTLAMPFEAESIPELCLKVVNDPPRSPLALRPDLPASIVAVIARCLEKDPAYRYADAAELATALEPFVSPASRVFAERARNVMAQTSVVPPPPAAQRSPSTRPSLTSGSRAESAARSTLVATAAEPPRRQASTPLVAVALGAVALVLAGFFALRGRPFEPSSVQVSAASMALTASMSPQPSPPDAPSASASPVVEPVPPASSPASSPAAQAPGSASAPAPAAPAPAAPETQQASNPAQAKPRSVPRGNGSQGPKPPRTNDEIPSIR